VSDYAQQIIEDRGARAGLDLPPYAFKVNDLTIWFSKAPWEVYNNTSTQDTIGQWMKVKACVTLSQSIFH
jgi:hypothetical protein